ncbi:MAG: lipid-A-disaccharide synthase N-terminal domain-containing protein [Proteobacteria bacterium]|nr:lipid-A-disaccharide synthase N-terminal domain-containing protein [Pseudomonadota bacterium]
MLDWSDTPYWLAFGLLGNAVFFSRFLVQWLASEWAQESVVPVAFWYLSLVGSLILLIYAIHIENLVFTLAFLPNGFVYLRNLSLIRNKRAREAATAD